MSDLRTELEKEIQEILTETIYCCGKKRITPRTFMYMMGYLRDLIRKLENKRFGCPTGLHSSNCLCDHGIYKTEKSIKRSARAA